MIEQSDNGRENIEKEKKVFSNKAALDTSNQPLQIVSRVNEVEKIVGYVLDYKQGQVVPLVGGADDSQLPGTERQDVAILGAQDGGQTGEGFLDTLFDLGQFVERGKRATLNQGQVTTTFQSARFELGSQHGDISVLG